MSCSPYFRLHAPALGTAQFDQSLFDRRSNIRPRNHERTSSRILRSSLTPGPRIPKTMLGYTYCQFHIHVWTVIVNTLSVVCPLSNRRLPFRKPESEELGRFACPSC